MCIRDRREGLAIQRSRGGLGGHRGGQGEGLHQALEGPGEAEGRLDQLARRAHRLAQAVDARRPGARLLVLSALWHAARVNSTGVVSTCSDGVFRLGLVEAPSAFKLRPIM
eukprot:14117785-Alexandrium_andersonii.AAC.1